MNSLLVLVLLVFFICPAVAEDAVPNHAFELRQGTFFWDGKPFQILAGEMHYPRIPRSQWHYAMRMARAMGLNTITTYVFWNEHEPQPGVYDFSGQNDLVSFIKTAQEEGLYVVLRPGPFVCAEWEFGGYPAWLLKDRSVLVRTSDPKYMDPARRWFQHLGPIVKPLLLANGGPIIAVQVENEYGSFGKDHTYMHAVKQMVVESGMGGTTDHPTLLYTADGGVQLPDGTLPQIPAAVNFGPGDGHVETERLQKFRPGGPRWVTEYWAGWFDHWGRSHKFTNTQKQVQEYEWLLRNGYSVNIYMLWGGTSFGWMNGANINDGKYEPDVTSYDYDAPISERGEPREKYFKFRDVIQQVTGRKPPAVPQLNAAKTYRIAPVKEAASLWENLPNPVHSGRLKTMEELGQSYGYILYTTHLHVGKSTRLRIDGLRDYASVYLNHKFLGTLDRRLGQDSLSLPSSLSGGELEILVENSGRVNYGKELGKESKGIVGGVFLGQNELIDWEMFPLPVLDPNTLHFRKATCTGPCYFRTSLRAGKGTRDDTYLDTSGIWKGFVWINGVPLGRAWNVGPQAALLIPGSWLRPKSDVVVLDLQADRAPTLKTVDHVIWIPGKNEPKH